MFHIVGIVQSMEKPEDVLELSLQLELLQVVELHAKGGFAVIVIRVHTPEDFDFPKGRAGGEDRQ